MAQKSVIVIGSGIGGSGIAALLSHRGYKVTVLEKLNLLGGRCCSRERDGFILDLGVHTFSQSGVGPLGEILRQSGGNDNAIQWSYAKNPIQKMNYLGKMIEYPKGLTQLGVNMDEYMNIINTIVRMPLEEIEKLNYITMKDWISQYTKDQIIYNMFAYMTELYFVIPPTRASAGEFIRSMQVQAVKRASGYPSGGCKVIPQSYLDVVTSKGGDIKKNAAVKKIIIENNIATGVELENGEILKADIIISNVDPGVTILKLAGEKYFKTDYTAKIKDFEYSPGAFILKFALKQKITDEKFIMYIGHPNADEYLKMIENNQIPEKVNLMIPVTSNLAPDTAPAGKQLIIAGSFPAIKPDWKAWEKSVMNSVKDVFPDIDKHIEFVETTSPEEVEKLVGEGGSVIGLSQKIDQVAKKRISQKTSVENLYLVGSEAGGWGIGTELAATSALELNKMI